MPAMNIFIPITKVDVAARCVYGIATAETVDKSGEIMDYDSTLPYYKAWSDEMHKASGGKSYGNVREMHSSIAAGKLTSINFDDVKKQVDVCAKIVDDSTWNKVLEGVLTGFSHGGEYIKRWKDKDDATKTRYTAKPAELSVVDNPCLGEATFEMIRSDGSTEMVKFKSIEMEKPARKPEQVWKATDGTTFSKRGECEAYELALDNKAKDTSGVLNALDELSKALDDKTTQVEEVIEIKKDLSVKSKLQDIADFNKGYSEAYDAKTAIEALCLLECLISGEEWEALMGEEEAKQIEDLKAAVSRIKSFVAAEIMEGETAKAAAAEDLEKAGARHSAADKGYLTKASGHLEDAKDHHESAIKAHTKMGDAHEGIEKCFGKMQDCMKSLLTADMLKTEEGKGLKGHLDEADDHLDKAVKQHGKLGKLHIGLGTAHEGMDKALSEVGAGADTSKDKEEADKAVQDEIKKLADSLEELKKQNEELVTKNAGAAQENADLNKTLSEVNSRIPELLARVNKLEKTPLPGKGVLYDAGDGGSVQKGHGIGAPEVQSVEVQKPVRGMSPEAQRRQIGII